VRNPAERLDLPRVERHEMRFLTPTEVGNLADAMPATYRALVILGAWVTHSRDEIPRR
jgi:hypothetical protein